MTRQGAARLGRPKHDHAAVLTLDAAEDGTVLPELVSSAAYGGAAVQDGVTGGTASATVTLEVPVAALLEERLSWGVHDPGGRSVAIGSFPLRAPAGAWGVRTATDAVAPGSALEVIVRADAGTSYSVTALDRERTGTLDGGGEILLTFAVAEALARGTYTVAYELTFPSAVVAQGRWPFDVSGTYLRVTSATLDREEAPAAAARSAGGTARAAVAAAISRVLTYTPGERARLSLVVETDTPVTGGVLRLWLQALDGLSWEVVEDRPLEILAADIGRPIVEELAFTLPDTDHPGTHRLIYEVWSPVGTILLHGVEMIEMTGIEPVSVELELADYPAATEAVRVVAEVMVYGAGRIEVWEGETLLASVELTGEGAQQALLTLPALLPGEHRLRVVFVSGTRPDEREVVLVYGTALADLVTTLTLRGPEWGDAEELVAGPARFSW
ncbi:MAG: hypothetical protein HYV63_20480 [Candidatus Schekmanbacteria bacterium]|nr:hypothetical protein [Candidatus Schekmanbacteria bacterium]